MRATRSSATAVTAALLIACGADASGPSSGSSNDRADLTIQYITRLPRLDYVAGSAHPDREGWPAAGQVVTWQAHVKNWSAATRDVGYEWQLDGARVASGTMRIAGGAVGSADYRCAWAFERRRLTLIVDPDHRITEEEEGNNELTVFTDAISLGVYIERSFYDFFRSTQPLLTGLHSTSFEDWVQRHVARLNAMLEAAVYPETPNGALDRVRLDNVTVIADNTLLSENDPNESDHSVDLIYGFRAAERASFDARLSSVAEVNPNYVRGSTIHEWGHARYLVDEYASELWHGLFNNRVEIREGTGLAVTSGLMPVTPWSVSFNGDPFVEGYRLFESPNDGLMFDDYTRIDRGSAAALNRIAGYRATAGNFNSPANLGAYTAEFARQNRLTITDSTGTPLAGAEVRIYQGTFVPPPDPLGWAYPYTKRIDNAPDLTLVTDDRGQVLLGENPFDVQVRPDPLMTTAVAIVRVAAGGRVGYGFLERRAFNLARWSGHADLAEFELRVALRMPAPAAHIASAR